MMKSKYQFSQSYSLDGYGRCYISGTSMLKRILPRDLSIITYLNLHNSNMSEVSSLKGLLNLRVLILSFNKLSQVGDGFKELTMLEVLDLSYNLFKRVDGLDYLKSLMTLDMSGNQLSSMNNLEHLLSQVPKLVHLNLRSNPVEELKDYKQQVFSLLPSLIELDCIPAMNTEAASIMHMEKCWSENSNIEAETTRKTLDLCNTMTQKGWKKDCKVHGGSSKNSLGFKIHLDNDPNGYAEEEVEEVCIEYRHLKSMLMFSNCSSLRKLSLPGNDIRVLEGLEHCTLLEELILEDNSINQVNQAVVLPTLWKLELGRNQLTSCVELGAFIGLTQLSIEKNNIISLKGLGALLSLMELYAAYNQLEDISEISNIRTLPKLMVLDLSGNQLCESSDYRSYSIFMLKKLKVLDGILVSDKELFDARERHMGRLTRDMLEEFLGRTNFSDMTVLDLSGKGIRHCGELFDHDDFAKLQELDLGYNFIACTHPFKSLKCLQKLVLQSNNIGNGPLLEDNSSVSFETYDSMESYPKDSNCSDESLPSTRVLNDFFSLQKLSNLNLDKNSISDIKSMKLQQSSPNLKLLSLKSNVITKIDGLSGLVFLEKLYLDNNCIKKIDPGSFENLPCLEELDLSNNSIRDVNHMEGLLSLRSLNLASNYLMPDRLGGFSCVKELSSLKKLQDLSLKENPVYRHPHYRSAIISILVQLQSLDGEVVTEEELAEAGMYMRREEKASEVWCGSEHDTFSPMVDSQSLLQTPTVTNLSGGKVALKITPFNFETMSIQVPMTVYSTYYQAPGNKSYDSWDAESMKKSIGTTYQSATSFSQSKQEGENRHPLGILSMRNFVRLNSKEKQAR
ncbi:hypothetical protein KP509_19G018500 [Ceratopteris richardii]|nr:hypothetical protein KP509_19G018500 [Ceratopteris richardii]